MELINDEYSKEVDILNKNEKEYDLYLQSFKNYENKKALTKKYLMKLQESNKILNEDCFLHKLYEQAILIEKNNSLNENECQITNTAIHSNSNLSFILIFKSSCLIKFEFNLEADTDNFLIMDTEPKLNFKDKTTLFLDDTSAEKFTFKLRHKYMNISSDTNENIYFNNLISFLKFYVNPFLLKYFYEINL